MLSLLQEYIHRVGRTARGNEGRGHALLLLLPEELAFLRYLKQAKVSGTKQSFGKKGLVLKATKIIYYSSLMQKGEPISYLTPHWLEGPLNAFYT